MEITTVTVFWQKSTKNKEVYAEVGPEGQAKMVEGFYVAKALVGSPAPMAIELTFTPKA